MRWRFATKVGITPPSTCGTTILKYLFEAVTVTFPLKKWVFLTEYVIQLWSSLTVYFCPGFETMNESVNARIANVNWRLPLEWFFLFIHEPYNKQLSNLDRSVVTGKSQTSAYRIDLAIARSIRQGLSLRFSRNDLTLGYQVVNSCALSMTSDSTR